MIFKKHKFISDELQSELNNMELNPSTTILVILYKISCWLHINIV